MIPSIQITGTIHEPESYTILSGATTGTINLPDTSLIDLQNIVNPVNFNIANLVTYIGKRILIEKPQDTTGIVIDITAPIPFSGTGLSVPLSTTYTLPDGPIALELIFGSTTYISVADTGSGIPVIGTVTRTLYVSPFGLDSNPGNALYPFLTIQKAIDTVTLFGDASPTQQYKIIIAGGTYNENITMIPFINLLSHSGDDNSVVINGTVDLGALDVSQCVAAFESIVFNINPNVDISGWVNSPYIRFIECEFRSGSNFEVNLNSSTIFALIGCIMEADKMYCRGGGWIFSNTRSLLNTGHVEFDDAISQTEVYLFNTTFLRADVHLRCSADITAIYHLADCYFEQSLRIDEDTSRMTVYYDKLPFSNNFLGIVNVNFNRISDSFAESYSPSNPSNWLVVPNNVKSALDTVSDQTQYTYTASVPANWTNSFSLINPTNLRQALDAVANNMNERYASRYRIQNLNATSTFGFNGLNNSNLLTLGVGTITLGGTGTLTLSSTGANTVMTSGTTMNITSGTGMSINSGGNLNVTVAGGGTILTGTSTSINCTIGNMSMSTNSVTGNTNLGSSANTSGTTNITSGFNISMQIINGTTLLNGSMVRGKGVPSSTTTSNRFFGASDGVTLANASLVTFYSPTHFYYALPATNSSYTVDVIANLSDNADPLNFFTARISAVFGSAGVSYTIINQTTTYTYQQGFVPPVSATLTAVANAISVSFTHAGYTCRPKASWEWMKVA